MATVKSNLVRELGARPGLSGVPIEYGDNAKTARRERIWLGASVTGEHEITTMRAGRKVRYEELLVEVHVEVFGRTTSESSELRAGELVAEIEGLLAADPTIDSAPGVQWAVVSQVEIDTSEADGPRTEALVTITVKARLT